MAVLASQDPEYLQYSDEDDYASNDILETSTLHDGSAVPEENAGPGGLPHGVKRRIGPNSACDRCRGRKSRCDGGFPCAFCASRDGICTYSNQPPAKKAKKSPTPPQQAVVPRKATPSAIISTLKLLNGENGMVANQGLRKEHTLMHSYAREYYIDLYSRHVMRCFPMFGPATSVRIAAVMPESPNTLAYNMTLALAARAVGHSAVAVEIFKECHALAANMIDHFSDKTAAGFMLMGLYQWGEDNVMARHYFSISNSIAKQCNPANNPKAPKLVVMLEEGRLLQNPDRPYFGERLQDVIPFPALLIHCDMMKDLEEVVKHPFLEEVLDRARSWPIRSTYMDYFCRIRLVTRYPVQARTDTLWPLERTMMMLKCIQHDDETVRMARRTFLTQNAPPSEFRHILTTSHVALTGLRCLVCAMGGLAELGCYFAREGIETLEKFSASHHGFSHNHIAVAVLSIACFVGLYKRNPFNEGMDYRACLLRLSCNVQGLSQFKIMHDIVQAIESELSEEINRTPARMQALMGEVLPEASWLKANFPDLDTILNEIMDANPDRNTVQMHPMLWSGSCFGVWDPTTPLPQFPKPQQDADPETARAMDYDESIYGNIDFLRQQTASVNTTTTASSTLAGVHTDETRTASTEPMTPASPMHLYGGVGSVSPSHVMSVSAGAANMGSPQMMAWLNGPAVPGAPGMVSPAVGFGRSVLSGGGAGGASGVGASPLMSGMSPGASASPTLNGMDIAMLDAMLSGDWQGTLGNPSQ